MAPQQQTFAFLAPESDGDGDDFFAGVAETADGFDEFDEGALVEDCGAALLGELARVSDVEKIGSHA